MMSYLDDRNRYVAPEQSLDPPLRGDEEKILLAFLERQRATFAWKCAGLDADQLQATIGPSAMTLGGMLKHLARFEADMSSGWLQGQASPAPWNSVDWEADPVWDWRTAAQDSPGQLFASWQSEVHRSRHLFAEALASGDPGRPGAELPDAPDALPAMRYILLNMIEEYARHNGHADLIRESIDGLVGQDPPGTSS